MSSVPILAFFGHSKRQFIRKHTPADPLAGAYFLCETRLPRRLAIMVSIRALLDESGQDIAEYAVMVAVILLIVVGTVRLIGSNANTVFLMSQAQFNNA